MNLFDSMRAAANGERAVRNEQWFHTKETRLAILCGAAEASPVFLAIAEAEADAEQRAINIADLECRVDWDAHRQLNEKAER